jgi:hypothetical protein
MLREVNRRNSSCFEVFRPAANSARNEIQFIARGSHFVSSGSRLDHALQPAFLFAFSSPFALEHL